MLLHPRLVDLHDVGAGGEQILDLGIEGGRIVERHRLGVAVKIVLRLLAQGERARHRRLDRAAGVGAQHRKIAQYDGPRPADRADHARHRNGPAGPAQRRARPFHVDAVERRGETVGIAFAPLLAVGDDVEPGALLVADREDGGVVLRRFEMLGRDAPEIVGAHARHLRRQPRAVDQPLRLRVGADEGGWQQHRRSGVSQARRQEPAPRN